MVIHQKSAQIYPIKKKVVPVRVDQVAVVVNQADKEIKMKTVNKIVISITAVLGLGLTVATVHAQQGPMVGMGSMGNGMSPGVMRGGMMQGQTMGLNSNMKIMRELMTPAERLSMMDKIMDAKTVEERQEIMISTHTEMEKRAKEKGISLPVGLYPQMMSGRICE